MQWIERRSLNKSNLLCSHLGRLLFLSVFWLWMLWTFFIEWICCCCFFIGFYWCIKVYDKLSQLCFVLDWLSVSTRFKRCEQSFVYHVARTQSKMIKQITGPNDTEERKKNEKNNLMDNELNSDQRIWNKRPNPFQSNKPWRLSLCKKFELFCNFFLENSSQL